MSSEKTVGLWPLFTIYGCIVKKFNRLGKWETDLSCVSGSSGNFRRPCIAQGQGELPDVDVIVFAFRACCAIWYEFECTLFFKE